MYSSPNISELRSISRHIQPNYVIHCSTQLDEIIELSKIATKRINFLIVTLGSKGVVTARRVKEIDNERMISRLYPVTTLKNIENVSGAGDCFSSGFIHGTLLGLDESYCISIGLEAAKLALLCKQTVPLHFNFTSNMEQAKFESLNKIDCIP